MDILKIIKRINESCFGAGIMEIKATRAFIRLLCIIRVLKKTDIDYNLKI